MVFVVMTETMRFTVFLKVRNSMRFNYHIIKKFGTTFPEFRSGKFSFLVLSTLLFFSYCDKNPVSTIDNIEQNENADGTIDPSHIEFSFKGKDKYGLTMNSDFDQVTGFSGIA